MTECVGRKLRVGVIGCGEVGMIHARAYLENPAVEFVGVCDVDPARLAEQAAQLHVAAFGDATELADRGKPDLVSVVVRFDELAAPVRECLELGIDVLCEKPVSFDSLEILSLARLAQTSDRAFGVNFNQRFSTASQWFRELREAGQFGEILWTLAQYNQGGGAGYFALREHMIHQLDMWRYHVGEVSSVTAQARWSGGGRATRHPDVIGATLEFVDGPIGVFSNGAPLVGGLNHYFELVGSEGRGYCENFVGRAIFRPSDGLARYQEPPWLDRGGVYWDTFAAHLDRVVQARVSGADMPVSVWDAFEAQCVCDAIVQAIESGRRISVQEVRQAALRALP